MSAAAQGSAADTFPLLDKVWVGDGPKILSITQLAGKRLFHPPHPHTYTTNIATSHHIIYVTQHYTPAQNITTITTHTNTPRVMLQRQDPL